MKTAKFTSVIATLSLVFFMALTSIANSGTLNTGDLPRSGDKSPNISNVSEKDFSYLRFDVTRYSSENEESDFIHSPLNYLQFDVNDYINENSNEVIELPAANEYEYLRFNLNNYDENTSASISELPANEFNYLRFDVNNYVKNSNYLIGELPVIE
jgi:hypothetical protein